MSGDQQNGHAPPPPPVQRVVVDSDGFRVRVDTGGLPFDVVERLLLGATAHIQRELTIARMLQAEALREQAKPRVHLPGGPMI